MSERCYACFRPVKFCLCKYTKPVNAGVKFVFLMHPKEAKRQRTGTGRIAHVTLVGSELFVGLDFSGHARLHALLNDSRYVPVFLYPGDGAWTAKSPELAAALGTSTNDDAVTDAPFDMTTTVTTKSAGDAMAGATHDVTDAVTVESADSVLANDVITDMVTTQSAASAVANVVVADAVTSKSANKATNSIVTDVVTTLSAAPRKPTTQTAHRKTPLVLVVDATWFCSRKVIEHNPFLLDLPRISFAGKYRSGFVFKREPRPECVSTIEACYCLIKEMQEAGIADKSADIEPLMTVFRKLIHDQLQAQNDRLDGKIPSSHAYDWKYKTRVKIGAEFENTQSTYPTASSGVCCSHKVSQSGLIPFIPTQASGY